MELNLEQKKLIQASPAGQGLVKGVAGSGKTTVALHRALFLRRYYCLTPQDRLLLVTYNRTLINYLAHLYDKIEEEYKDYYQNIFSDQEDKVEIQNIDSIMYQYCIAQKGRLAYKLLFDKDVASSVLSECIGELSKKYAQARILDERNVSFLMDEIIWIKACHYLEIEEYQGADRLGRSSQQSKDGPQKLLKNSETRKAIFELMQLYDRKLKEKGYLDFSNINIMALHYAKENKEKNIIILL